MRRIFKEEFSRIVEELDKASRYNRSVGDQIKGIWQYLALQELKTGIVPSATITTFVGSTIYFSPSEGREITLEFTPGEGWLRSE